ncbi:DUF983 domain-containing protein [Stakelama sediminis]|uniref:Uncharacterized protein (DUF983 family) n=1 Tax=Stakelama sediminis TaxID=463200 RepID=A0A840YVN2_9SPHN|nr:DUF983 domain-containing protein [Stakelama sediminis]MBB5717761.1 uncharacterized protein (DUF983 family) [Stakelama sediminis]
MSEPTPAAVALKGLCPRCGAHGLFATTLGFAPKCRACGLDFSAFNVGDGPAAFLILIWGALICIGAITVELVFSPPIWVHMLLWIPLTLIGVVASLRMAKALLLALEYRNAAREGRIAPPDA